MIGRAPLVIVTATTELLSGVSVVSQAAYLRVGAAGDDAGVALLLQDQAAVERLRCELDALLARMSAHGGPAAPRPPHLVAVPSA